MLQRRNTIDSSSSSWPICKYYFTHNTGSCDDVLLYKKKTIPRIHGKKRLKKRRFTYPFTSKDRKTNQLNKKEKAYRTAKRWSTERQTNMNKRQTLANILTNISTSKKVLLPNKVVIDNKTLSEKWESIRLYNHAEKIEQAGPSTSITMPTVPEVDMTATRTSTTLTNNSIHTNSSLVANASSFFAGQEMVSLSTDSEQGLSFNEKKSSQKEMLLFLFGFLIFPLWWIGAWQYIIKQQDHQSIPKHREVFQILNCLMSLASLLLVGLMIGLTTVWA